MGNDAAGHRQRRKEALDPADLRCQMLRSAFCNVNCVTACILCLCLRSLCVLRERCLRCVLLCSGCVLLCSHCAVQREPHSGLRAGTCKQGCVLQVAAAFCFCFLSLLLSPMRINTEHNVPVHLSCSPTLQTQLPHAPPCYHEAAR